MAEGTYEYECMRAELLGVGKPDHDEFLQRKREAEENRRLAAEVEEEAVEATNLEAAVAQGETLNSTTGKMDELNSILNATQKRLDRFKVRCGSVTELIRTKIGSTISGSSEALPVDEDAGAKSTEVLEAAAAQTVQKSSELTNEMDNHVGKLDSLLGKAERAELSLKSQNERIKKLLK